MPISQRNEHPDVSSDTNRLSANVYWNAKLHRWDTLDKNKDSFVIDIVNNFAEEGYVSFKRASATTGEPVFTELFKIDHEGVITSRGHPIHIVVESATAPTSPFEGMGWLDTSSL